MTDPDSSYHKPQVAQTYDVENSGRTDTEFYLRLASELSDDAADFAILDIGCGTGSLGAELAGAGHRVTGVDPSMAMLDIARARPGGELVTWIHGDAGDVPADIVNLVVMTGHVAQYFLDAADWAELLHHAHRALRPGGRIAFESRNPADRAWERWTRELTTGVYPHPDGGDFTSWVELVEVDEDDPEGVLETHHSVTIYPDGSRSDGSETLRFRTLGRLTSSLESAGFEIERVYGDWSRGPVTQQGPEYILVARRS